MRGTPASYFKSLNVHFHVLGVERSLFYLFVGIALPIAFSARLLPLMDMVAGLVFMALYVVGVWMTRVDPQLLALYRRHIHYRNYYAAVAGVHANVPIVKASVPVYQGKRGLI